VRADLKEAGEAATVASFLYAAFVRPWSKEAKQRRSDRKLLRLWVHGSPAVAGFFEAVASGPERVEAVERKVRILEGVSEKVKRGNEKAIAETVRTRQAVQELSRQLADKGLITLTPALRVPSSTEPTEDVS